MTEFRRSSGSRALQEVAAEKIRTASAWLRDYITAIKKGQMHPFTSTERKAREATRNEPWGPTGKQLNELAEATHNSTECEIIFAVIHFRLGYPPDKWRNVYKALVVLDFLVQKGSERGVELGKEDIFSKLTALEKFSSVTAEGRDHGVNVRHRAKAIKELLLDSDRLSALRAGHKKKQLAYQGYSRDQMLGSKPFHDDQDIPSPLGTARAPSLRRTLSEGSLQEASQHGDGAQSGYPRNAGETKGVTMEMNKKHLADLKELLALPHNRYCADCTGGGGAARASWASINTGVFICMQCAGLHRGLGTHISKVRSCTLDTWLPEQVEFMAQTGNQRANEYYEARLAADRKPAYGSKDIAAFVRRKYADREFASDGIWPPHLVRHLEHGADSADESKLNEARERESMHRVPQRLGSRVGRQGSLAFTRSFSKQLSVPLPRPSSGDKAAPSQPTAVEPELNLMDSLMSFDETLESQQASPPADDVFANLATLEPALSRPPTNEYGYNSMPAMDSSGDRAYAVAHPTHPLSHTAPSPAHPLISQPSGVSSIGFTEESVRDWSRPPASHEPPTTAVGHLFGGGRLGSGSHGMPQASASTAGFSAVQQESLRLPRVPPRSLSRRASAAEYDLQSAASTPMFTPRLSQLLGPGPSQGGWQTPVVRSAAVPYKPLNSGGTQRTSQSALEQSANLWKANAKQGKAGGMDELVLHALAGLPPQPHSDVHRALTATPRPKPSLAQQRAALML